MAGGMDECRTCFAKRHSPSRGVGFTQYDKHGSGSTLCWYNYRYLAEPLPAPTHMADCTHAPGHFPRSRDILTTPRAPCSQSRIC